MESVLSPYGRVHCHHATRLQHPTCLHSKSPHYPKCSPSETAPMDHNAFKINFDDHFSATVGEFTSQAEKVMIQKQNPFLPDAKALSPRTHLPQHANTTSSFFLHLNSTLNLWGFFSYLTYYPSICLYFEYSIQISSNCHFHLIEVTFLVLKLLFSPFTSIKVVFYLRVWIYSPNDRITVKFRYDCRSTGFPITPDQAHATWQGILTI